MKTSKVLFWTVVAGLSIMFTAGVVNNRLKPQVEYKSKKIDYNEKKAFYKDGINNRNNTMFLNYKLSDSVVTNIQVDKILVPAVNDFLIKSEEYGVSLERLGDLDFIGYDYLLYEESVLGFTQPMLYEKDYIVLNSHQLLSPFRTRLIVFHELVHLLKQDGKHTEGDESLIMTAIFNEKVFQAITTDYENQEDLLFKELIKHQENGTENNAESYCILLRR